MGSIPLAALSVKPPEDPTQGIERAFTLRNLLQNAPIQRQILQQQAQAGQLENQQRDLAIKSTQATMRAYTEADGDPEKTVKLASKYGALPKDTLALQQAFTQQKMQTLELVSKQGAEAKRQADLMQGAHDQVAASDNKPVAYAQSLQSLAKQGVDVSQIPQQYPGDEAFKVLGIAVRAHTQQVEDALKQAETSKNAAEAAEKQQTAQFYKDNPRLGAPGVPAETVTLKDYMGMPVKSGEAPHTPANFPAWKAKNVAEAELPSKIAVANALAKGGDAAVRNVAPKDVGKARADATKAGEDYAAAKSVADRMQATMDAAKKGNVISYQIIPEEGTLQITTSQGVHRINRTEIEQYAGGGSLWQRLEGHIGRQLTGKSIPDSVLKDMAEIQKIQAQGARSKYENTLKTINHNYNSEFTPVDMDTMKNAGSHTFTLNGRRYENVPEELYQKYKNASGFSE